MSRATHLPALLRARARAVARSGGGPWERLARLIRHARIHVRLHARALLRAGGRA